MPSLRALCHSCIGWEDGAYWTLTLQRPEIQQRLHETGGDALILAELMKYEGEIAERARERQRTLNNKPKQESETLFAPVQKADAKEGTPIHTHEVLADLAGVSPRTVASFQKIKRSLPEPEYNEWVQNKSVWRTHWQAPNL